MLKRSLILEDGTVLTGNAFGSEGQARGEVVFYAGMTGYQEIVDRPELQRAYRDAHLSFGRQLRHQPRRFRIDCAVCRRNRCQRMLQHAVQFPIGKDARCFFEGTRNSWN